MEQVNGAANAHIYLRAAGPVLPKESTRHTGTQGVSGAWPTCRLRTFSNPVVLWVRQHRHRGRKPWPKKNPVKLQLNSVAERARLSSTDPDTEPLPASDYLSAIAFNHPFFYDDLSTKPSSALPYLRRWLAGLTI